MQTTTTTAKKLSLRSLYTLIAAAERAGETVVVASATRALRGDAAANRACVADYARLVAVVR